MTGERNPALLLIGHGSQDSRGVAQFWALSAEVGRQAPHLLHGAGFIEWAEPGLDDAIDALVSNGARAVVAVPLVLLGAGHRKDDGPAALARARLRHRGVAFSYARELGVDPDVLAVAEDRARATIARLSPSPSPVQRRNSGQEGGTAPDDLSTGDATAVVLVGRGSTDPDANADLYKVARLLADSRDITRRTGHGSRSGDTDPEQLGSSTTAAAGKTEAGSPATTATTANVASARSSSLAMVEPAFVSLAPPLVPEAMDRCRRLGAAGIAVLPYFLFTGVLVERIRLQAGQWAAAHPDTSVSIGEEMGADPRIASLVLERYMEAVNGRATINCDCCVHRVPLPGYEARVRAPLPLARTGR